MLYYFGPFRLHAEQHTLELKGELVSLTPKAIDLLLFLVENADRIVTKDEISAHVWDGAFIEDSNIAKNISLLRRVLREPLGDVDPIRTVFKRGYQFTFPVTMNAPEIQVMTPSVSAGVPPDAALEPVSNEDILPALILPTARRSRIAWVLPLLLLLGATTLGSFSFQRWKSNRDAPSRPCLAILEFKNLSQNEQDDWLATALPEAVRIDTQFGGDVRTVSDDRVAQAERELHLAGTTAYTANALQSVRQSLECPLVVSGSYLTTEDRLRVDMQFQDASTGKSLGSFSQTDQKNQLMQIAANAAASLRQQLKLPLVPVSQQNEQAVFGTADALSLYAQGLQLLRSGDVLQAQKRLSLAVAAAPDSALAHTALARAWSQMGYDAKASQEAQLGLDHSAALPREQKLLITAVDQSMTHQRSAAVATYTRLVHDYPDTMDYSVELAQADTLADKPKDALAVMDAVWRRDANSRNDPRVNLAKADAHRSLNEFRNELVSAGDAIQQSRARSARFFESQGLLLEGSAWMKLGNPDRAQEDFEAAEKISEDLQDQLGLGQALNFEAQVISHRESGNAEPIFRRALDIERATGSRRAMITSLNDLATCARNDANMYAARELYQQALSLAQEIEDRPAESNELLSLGNINLNTGDPVDALKYYNQAHDVAIAIHNRRLEAISLGNAAVVQFTEGDLNGARKQQQQVLALKQQLGDSSNSIAVTLDYLTQLEIAAGNLKAARAYSDSQVSLLKATGIDLLRDQINYSIIAMEEGNPAYAETPMAQLAAASPKPSPGAEALRVLALSRLARGELAKAREASERDVALARTSPNVADYFIPASIVAARINAAEGHTELAYTSLQSLLRDAEKIKNVRLGLEIRLALGQVEHMRGREAESRHTLQAVQLEASQRGFGLVARKASEALARKV